MHLHRLRSLLQFSAPRSRSVRPDPLVGPTHVERVIRRPLFNLEIRDGACGQSSFFVRRIKWPLVDSSVTSGLGELLRRGGRRIGGARRAAVRGGVDQPRSHPRVPAAPRQGRGGLSAVLLSVLAVATCGLVPGQGRPALFGAEVAAVGFAVCVFTSIQQRSGRKIRHPQDRPAWRVATRDRSP